MSNPLLYFNTNSLTVLTVYIFNNVFNVFKQSHGGRSVMTEICQRHNKQARQCTYTVTLWHICVTTVAMETQHVPCVVNLNVAVNNIKMLCAATKMQQWFPFALLSSYRVFLLSTT